MVGNPTPRPYWTPDVPVVRLTEQERTSYREQIRELVAGASLTFTWLIRQLSDEGLMTDKYEMSATLSGVRTGEKQTKSFAAPLIFYIGIRCGWGHAGSRECLCTGSSSPG